MESVIATIKVCSKMFTCTLRRRYIRTCLIFEEQPTVVGAGVNIALRHWARTVAAVVGEGHWPVKRTGHCTRLLAKHRVEQGISGNVRAQRWKGVLVVTIGCATALQINKIWSCVIVKIEIRNSHQSFDGNWKFHLIVFRRYMRATKDKRRLTGGYICYRNICTVTIVSRTRFNESIYIIIHEFTV